MSNKLDHYIRQEILELTQYDKPIIVMGRYISPATPEDAYSATFANVKPYCSGYYTYAITNHVNFVRDDAEQYYHFDMDTVGEWFYLCCRICTYEGKGSKEGVERAGLCLTNELGISPIIPVKFWRDLRLVSKETYLDFSKVADGKYIKESVLYKNKRKPLGK